MIQVDVTHVGENCMKENVGCVILTKEFTYKVRSDFMNEKTLLGVDCNGTEIYGQLDKISVHTNNHLDYDGSSWGWLEGCSKFVCWSNRSSSRFTKKDADELANKWNNRR